MLHNSYYYMTLWDRRFVSLLTFVLSHSLPNSWETRDCLMINLIDHLKTEGLQSMFIPVKYRKLLWVEENLDYLHFVLLKIMPLIQRLKRWNTSLPQCLICCTTLYLQRNSSPFFKLTAAHLVASFYSCLWKTITLFVLRCQSFPRRITWWHRKNDLCVDCLLSWSGLSFTWQMKKRFECTQTDKQSGTFMICLSVKLACSAVTCSFSCLARFKRPTDGRVADKNAAGSLWTHWTWTCPCLPLLPFLLFLFRPPDNVCMCEYVLGMSFISTL